MRRRGRGSAKTQWRLQNQASVSTHTSTTTDRPHTIRITKNKRLTPNGGGVGRVEENIMGTGVRRPRPEEEPTPGARPGGALRPALREPGDLLRRRGRRPLRRRRAFIGHDAPRRGPRRRGERGDRRHGVDVVPRALGRPLAEEPRPAQFARVRQLLVEGRRERMIRARHPISAQANSRYEIRAAAAKRTRRISRASPSNRSQIALSPKSQCYARRRTRRTLAARPRLGRRAREIGTRSPTRPLVAQKKHNTPPYDPPRDGALDEGADPPPSLSF